MIVNETRLAIRRLIRSRGYVLINIVGLAAGLACCVFIAVYLQDEFSYERSFKNVDRIVRFVEDQETTGRLNRSAMTYAALAPAIETDLPAVEHAVRVYPHSLLMGRDRREARQEDNLLFVDSTFFDVFSFEAVSGNLPGALDAPFSIVLTVDGAAKYFGSDNPVGQSIRAWDDDEQKDFVVTAVIENPPPNTHLQFDLAASYVSARWLHGTWIDDPQNWHHPPMYTYALLGPSVAMDQVDAALTTLAANRMGPDAATRSLKSERLTDIRLHSSRQGERVPSRDIVYVYVFAAIALMILVLACINFGNLSAAAAVSRIGEVATRKALGARRFGLVRLFVVESVLVVLVSIVVVAFLVATLLPVFNDLSGKQITARDLLGWTTVVGALGTVLIIGTVAGMWPALMISRRPGVGLFGRAHSVSGRGGGRLRRGLVVFQFTVSVALILATLTIRHQLDYLVSERLGFEKERVVLVPLRDVNDQINHAGLLDVYRGMSGVESATASSGMPGLNGGIYDWVVKPKNGRDDSLTLMVLTVEPDYAETYGLQFVSGRDFDREHIGDATSSFLVNEAAAERMGWTPENAIGQSMSLGFWFDGHTDKQGEIVGVVRNFQYHSLHRAYEPLVFHMLPDSYYYDYVSVRIAPGAVATTLPALESAWKSFNADRPFESRFLDDQFDALYRSEGRLSRLVGLFAILAVIIAGLGLFGLAALTVDRRTKEIGIRKVFGATSARLFGLLWGDLLRPVLLALVVAVPITIVVVDGWLSRFAEHVQPTGASIITTGVLAVAVSLIAVAYHAIRAAIANPIDSLRYE